VNFSIKERSVYGLLTEDWQMALHKHYRIDYLLHGSYKTFYVSALAMDNAEAWHWASVDAGFGQIPKYRTDKVPKISKPKAEQLGISQVEWTESVAHS
jgi:hypothetical protein